MKITGQLAWTDFLHAQFLHTRPVWWERLVQWIAIAILVAGFLSVMLPAVAANGLTAIWEYIWLPILVAAVLLLFYYVFLPRSAHNLFERQKELSAPFEYEITPGGLVASDRFGQGTRPWDTFRKWKENKDLFLLYALDAEFIIIPKRLCTPEQVDALRSRLQENQVPQAGVASRRSVLITLAVVIVLLIGAVLYTLPR